MDKELIRYPQYLQTNNLFAWSSADELLIDHVLKIKDIESKEILIINDQFGALSRNFSSLQVTTYTDSYLSAKSIEINTNGSLKPVNSLKDLDGSYDLVLVYLPKNNSFFEDILCHLTQILRQDTVIIFTGMVKHISKGHFSLIEKYIGKLTTSLAVKKARLIFSKFTKEQQNSPFPKSIQVDNFEYPFFNHSNIFSRDKLDIGTRFFLENIPTISRGKILDLGCANGIIGIRAKLKNSDSEIYFTDESMMAIESAKENYERYCFDEQGKFFWTHNMEGLGDELFDLILCNPPFHQGTTVGTHIAIDMFKSSFSNLKIGGRLIVIANSHLGYHTKLKRIFGNYKRVNSNKKFVIYECFKY